ncbi:MAG: rhamnulokinase [Candidatus Lokiarchaeota archaeon]|nr:rhamnulokinase [Candidatus Lokiarchaeota archaeon]
MDADYIAFDFGASSARAIAGKLDQKLEFMEIYRFKTGASTLLNSMHWDIIRFYDEVKNALKIQAKTGEIKSIGFDSWGVDYVLLDAHGDLIGAPFHYRDHRTDGIMERAYKKLSRKEIFKVTGIQFMQINSLFQLYSMKLNNSPQLKIADTYLMIADFFNYLFTGKKFCEYTLASTSQLLDLQTKNWAFDLIKTYGLPETIFPKIVPSGTKLGNIRSSLAEETGISPKTTIIAPATHDTGSAIASIPASEDNFIYISSGTWALMGTEISKPNISDKALKYNFTNEGGVFNTIRFLKNIIGFWLLQECKRIWEIQSGQKISYSDLTREAIKPEIKPFKFLIYPDWNEFLNPKNMVESIKTFCKLTGQETPVKIGEIVRCILESLAFRYREVYEDLTDIFGQIFKKIYIVGGGAQNTVLSQFTANITNLKVSSGPVEATAIGNLLLQAYGLNEIKSLRELREIVRASVEIREFSPKNTSFWDEGYKKYKTLNYHYLKEVNS